MTRQTFPTISIASVFGLLALTSTALLASEGPVPQRQQPQQRQVDHIQRAYDANSRAAAVQAETDRHRHVLDNFQQMHEAATELCYRKMHQCVEIHDIPAREQCTRDALAEHKYALDVLQQAAVDEAKIHSQNLLSINKVWSGQSGWNPGAVADNRRQAQQQRQTAGRPATQPVQPRTQTPQQRQQQQRSRPAN